jgi:hypothetical protein
MWSQHSDFRYRAGTPPGVGRISFFGLRTLYPLCTLWGYGCGKSSDLTPIRAGVVGKFSGRVRGHAGFPARYRKFLVELRKTDSRVPVHAGNPAWYRNYMASDSGSGTEFRYRAGNPACPRTRPENFPTTPARMGVKSELLPQPYPHNVQRGYNVRNPKKEILPAKGRVPADYRNNQSARRNSNS